MGKLSFKRYLIFSPAGAKGSRVGARHKAAVPVWARCVHQAAGVCAGGEGSHVGPGADRQEGLAPPL